MYSPTAQRVVTHQGVASRTIFFDVLGYRIQPSSVHTVATKRHGINDERHPQKTQCSVKTYLADLIWSTRHMARSPYMLLYRPGQSGDRTGNLISRLKRDDVAYPSSSFPGGALRVWRHPRTAVETGWRTESPQLVDGWHMKQTPNDRCPSARKILLATALA